MLEAQKKEKMEGHWADEIIKLQNQVKHIEATLRGEIDDLQMKSRASQLQMMQRSLSSWCGANETFDLRIVYGAWSGIVRSKQRLRVHTAVIRLRTLARRSLTARAEAADASCIQSCIRAWAADALQRRSEQAREEASRRDRESLLLESQRQAARQNEMEAKINESTRRVSEQLSRYDRFEGRLATMESDVHKICCKFPVEFPSHSFDESLMSRHRPVRTLQDYNR